MTVGFVMLAHAGLHRAQQVAHVISAAGCPLIVHVDSRMGEEFRAFKAKVAKYPEVTLGQRTECEWGTWALVQASMDAAEDLLRKHPNLNHIYLMSGACLPIKPIAELVSFLEKHPETDFIESVTIREVPWTKGGLSEERFTLSFPFPWKKHRRLFDLWVEAQRLVKRRRRGPTGLKPHMGSQWWCLTRATLERILQDSRRDEFERYFRRVWIPDESFFQSLVRLYGTKVESRSLTLSKFDTHGRPHVFYDDHLALLRQSPLFVARKIWPGADQLYRAFLDGRFEVKMKSQVSAAQIDRTFTQAITRRTRGRPGLVMASRYPSKSFEGPLTAAPYAVFHGFSDVFSCFDNWIRAMTGSRAHGHLFDPSIVQFFGGQLGYTGALSANAALRDYDPQQFLANLIWHTRGEHQSFMFSPRDCQAVTKIIAADRNALISVVTGAWALPLLRSGRSIEEVRAEAAILQQAEAEFIEVLKERRTRARAQVWSLAEFLEHPLLPLQEIVDGLSGPEPRSLDKLPAFKQTTGLSTFLQSLRNAGMNPYMAGEISEEVAASVAAQEANRFDE